MICRLITNALAGVALLGALIIAPECEAARTHGGYYTKERLANARRNAAEYDWGRELRQAAVKNAASWVARDDDELWAMIPGQELGRCIDVTLDRNVKQEAVRLGCLQCGERIFKHGNYPYEPDFEDRPWKLTCPSCGVVFPTNDFGSYYRSGIDERGVFDPSRANKALLFNVAHPDPKDSLHRFGVDDGFGFVDSNGRSHRFVGYYTWKYWRWLYNGIKALADAFVYTGDPVYAHKAAVMLDRLADVYPSLDWKPYADRGWYHSDGGRNLGKIEGGIWETYVVSLLAESYDAILSGTTDDEALWKFLEAKARQYRLPQAKKGSRDLFVWNVDEGLLRCAFEAVVAGRIRGNEGMHQVTAAVCALALDTEPDTSRWLDWVFAPDGGAVPGLMFAQFDRDGFSDEAAPGYALLWGLKISDLAFRLAEYPRYRKNDILRDYPAMQATFTASQRAAVFGRAMPNIGDAGGTGLVANSYHDAAFIAKGYRHLRLPELAAAAWRANGGSARGLGRDIFAPEPDEIGREIERLAAGAGANPHPPGGELLPGFGLALLEMGAGPTGTGVALNYGRTTKHGHRDLLNFDLFAFGKWLAPDLGYPEFATSWPHRDAWSINTVSHNTVVVDGKPQKPGWGGHLRLFQRVPGLSVVQLEAKDAYPGLKAYRRTLLLAEVPGRAGHAYVVDVFHVSGGQDHLYSFHGPPGEIVADGLKLAAQSGGTYAGPDIPYAAPAKGFPLGYSYLYDVRRDSDPAPGFTLDWKAEPGYRGLGAGDDVHVRLHVTTACDDVALAHGDPPQNKAGNPRRLGYALLHRAGQNLSSTFATVIEPYRAQPFIKSVERLPTGRDEQVALKVELADGTVDHVLVNLDSGRPLNLPGLKLDGAIGHVRARSGAPERATVVRGTQLESGAIRVASPGAFSGTVTAMNRDVLGGGWLLTEAVLPADGSLVGQPILIAGDGERDNAYVIRSVTREGGRSRIDCGPITFVRGFAGPQITVRGAKLPADYTQGYVYDFEPGAAFTIPVAAQWVRGAVGP